MSNTPPEEQAKPKKQYSRKNHRREKSPKASAAEAVPAPQQEVLKSEPVIAQPVLQEKTQPKPAPKKGKSGLLKEAFFKKNYLKDNPLQDSPGTDSPKTGILLKDGIEREKPAQDVLLKDDSLKDDSLKDDSLKEISQAKTDDISEKTAEQPRNEQKEFHRDGRPNPRFQKPNRRPEQRRPQPEQKPVVQPEAAVTTPAQPEGEKQQPAHQHTQPKPQHQHTQPKPQQPQPQKQKPQEKKRVPFIPLEPSPALTETDPFLKEFYRKLEDSLKGLGVENGSSIICAVSGGVDSVAMFHALLALAPSHGFRISVAHCNHNLRGKDSHRDEQFVRHITKKNNLYFNHTQVNVKHFAAKNSFSLEKAARVLRYRFFEKVARDSKFQYLATAHTADDAAETFFLNLLRGSGLTGLSGIPARRPLTNKTNVVRPVLHFTKAELIEYAKKRNLEWHEDETNSLAMFTRNKVRNELLPLLKEKFSPAVNDIIIRTMHLLQGADKVVAERVNDLMPHITETVNGQTLLKSTLFSGLDEFIQGEIIQKIITEKFDSSPVSYDMIDRMIALGGSEVGAICEVSKQVYALRDRDGILFIRKTPVFNLNVTVAKIGSYEFGEHKIILKEIPNRDLQFGADLNIEYFDADLLPQRLTLRTWQPGDAFQPIGMRGTMKVSDFLTNEKVPLLEKQNVLVLATSTDIIWVCGMRISDKFKVTERTDKVTSVEFIPPKH